MGSKDCEISTYQEYEYVDMIKDTSNLIAREKAGHLGEVMTAFKESAQVANEVEFWKWMGANYPKDLSNTELIRKAAVDKSRWLNTQLQGKGYEWEIGRAHV